MHSVICATDVSVADSGFPRGELTNDGAPTYYLANFSWKLHENKEIFEIFPVGVPTNEGAPTYYLANFSWKLRETEEILCQRRGTHYSHPLDLSLCLLLDNSFSEGSWM